MVDDNNKAVAVLVNTITHRDMQEVIRKTLPSGVSQERFTQAVVAALKHRPDLFMECDRASVYNAIVEAAKDGLLPDGRHGALVPFRSKEGPKRCQFLIMPEGIIDKLAKIGITAYAVSVYAGDKIRIWNDDHGQHVEHEPQTFGSRGERIGAFACARIRESGSTYVEAMNLQDLEAPRKVTKSKDKNGNLIGPWADFPDRMEQKTCLHRICKRLPNVSMEDDEEFRNERGPVTVDVPSPTPAAANGGRPAALQRVVDAVAETAPPAQEEPPMGEPP
jgi:phage RecT family recombinase